MLHRSIIFYFTCVMTLLWRTGTINDNVLQITPLIALGPRLSVTFIFVLGLIYLCFIIKEFRRYGAAMDKAWRTRVLEWKGTRFNTPNVPRDPSTRFNMPNVPRDPYTKGMGAYFPFSQKPPKAESETSHYPVLSFPPAVPGRSPPNSGEVPFDAIKLVDLGTNSHASYGRPWFLQGRDIGHLDWNRFIWVRVVD